MKKLAALLSLLLLSAAAHAAPPSEASINRLLNDMHVEKMLDAIMPQMEAMIRQSETAATGGKAPSPAEQKIVDKFHTKVVGIVNANLNMDKLRPTYVRIYSQNFTQEEVDGLITFLESPAGKAYVNKLPVVMQSVMAELPNLLNTMKQSIMQASKDMNDELVALHKRGAK